MKNKLKLILLACISATCFPGYSQQHLMRFFEAHADFPWNASVNYNGSITNVSEWGIGGSINAGKEFVTGVVEVNYRKINLGPLNIPDVKEITCTEFFFGLRYFPMKPTFFIGPVAFRVTAGALGGFDMEPNWRFLLFAGFAASPARTVSGLTVDFVYRPEAYPVKGYLIEPNYAVRAGIFIGPSAE